MDGWMGQIPALKMLKLIIIVIITGKVKGAIYKKSLAQSLKSYVNIAISFTFPAFSFPINKLIR